MNLFDMSIKRNVVDAKVILDKVEKSKSIKSNAIPKQTSSGPSLLNLINRATEMMDAYLGDKKDNYELITNNLRLVSYCDRIIENGIYAIDTETTGLNPMLDKIVGFSLYTPGEKPAYIPINHISYVTKQHLDNQIPEDFVGKQLSRVVESSAKAIYANAKFDIRILRHNCNVNVPPYFDCILAARMLNENEPSNRLKDLYKKYILHGEEDAFTFSDLFDGICFNLIPPNVGYLYAARDAEVTWELYQFQLPFLTPSNPLCIKQDLVSVADVFWNIEMPTIEVLADIEDTGVSVDVDITNNLENKYIPKLKEYEEIFNQKVLEYGITKHYDVSSSQQLAELFYDVLHLTPPNREHPRSTDKNALSELEHPIVDAVKDYRSVSTLVNTFVKKLPQEVNPNTSKIHCNYVQVGSEDRNSNGKAPVTGRLACKSPNMQQIPARGAGKDIRTMFCASTDYNILDSNDDNSFTINKYCEIRTLDGWKKLKNISVNDKIIIKNNSKEMVVSVCSISNRDENTICINWQ